MLEPFLIRHTAGDESNDPTTDGALTGALPALGLVCAVTIALAMLPFRHSLIAVMMLPMAAVIPGLLYQDAWRYLHFAHGLPVRALLTDTVWTVALLVGLSILSLGDLRGESAVVAATITWGIAGLFAAVIESVREQILPKMRSWRAVVRRYAQLGARFSAEFIVERGAGQLGVLAIGALAGIQAVGIVAAARTILAPVTTLYSGVAVYALREGASLHRDGILRPRSFAAKQSIILVVAAILVGIGLAVAPAGLVIRAFGNNWTDARSVLLPIVIFVAAAGLSEGPRCTLRALQAAGTTVRVRSTVALLVLGGTSLGAYLSGAEGAAWGMAFGSSGGALWWWIRFLSFDRLSNITRTI